MTEARRTWMSYRIVEDASDVTRVALMGDAGVTEAAAPTIGSMLDAESVIVHEHPLVDANGAAMDRVWPLAGMLLEPTLGYETIDFADPRRAPDMAARIRRWSVIAAGLLLVTALTLWTVGRRELGTLEQQLDRLETSATGMRGDYTRFQRETFTLAHLRRWESVDVRWMEHARTLHEILPLPTSTVLDGWTGTLDHRGVRYDRKVKAWSVPGELTIVLDGEASDRRAADAFREALVQTDLYRAASSGADTQGGRRLPFGFTYRLTTSEIVTPASDTGPAAKGGPE